MYLMSPADMKPLNELYKGTRKEEMAHKRNSSQIDFSNQNPRKEPEVGASSRTPTKKVFQQNI